MTQQLWEKDTRFVRVDVEQDLFGEWYVAERWGNEKRGLTGEAMHFCNSREEVETRLTEIAERYHARGYLNRLAPVRRYRRIRLVTENYYDEGEPA